MALVDECLDRGDGPFLLDGQAVVLDDYLCVRPERRDALAAALRDGRLEAGPWYVLADALIPGGEALARNLLAGRRALAALGAAPPPVCYAPDSFGHPASLPTLAVGFGLRVAIVWRGYGSARWPAGDAAWWQGPDGSRVLLYHLPPDGYEFGSRLPGDADAAAARWQAMHDVLAPRARLGVLLVANGADHHARQERWDVAVAQLAVAAAPARVAVTSLADLAARLSAAAGSAALPEVHGELRDAHGYTWTLQGTFASRAGQKRRVAGAERRLVRDVEPWLALRRLRGVGEPGADARGGALLHAAWQPLLRCLPHDTLCGCSTDEVARAMDARLDDADAQARGLRADALDALAGRDPVAARAARAAATAAEAWRPHLVVRNRAARSRGGLAEVALDAFVRDVGVGPGSAGHWRPATEPRRTVAPAGGLLVQPLAVERRHDRLESPRHYPDDDLVDRTTALAWLPPVPGYGLAAHALVAPAPSPGEPPPGVPAPTHPARVEAPGRIGNGRVVVTVDAAGRVSIAWPGQGRAWDDCVGLEDVSDAGDLYTPSLVGERRTRAWCDGVQVRHHGPLRATLAVALRLRVPAALRPHRDDPLSRPTQPAARHVELPVTLECSVDADAEHVRLAVRGDNLARDHRLRLVLRTGVAGATVRADAAFGPVVRAPLEVSAAERAVERPLPTAPLHRWVSLCDGARGATLVSDGLAEYEAGDDGQVAVTLVRAVGELSRPDLPERPGHAGWPVPTPEAQCPGPFAAALAVAAHDAWSDATAARVEHLAEDVLLPLAGHTVRDLLAAPASVAGLTLEGDGLAFAAAYPADDDGWVVLRCVNVGERAVDGAWTVDALVREAQLARLDGTGQAPLAVEPLADGRARVRFAAGPRAVVTVRVRGAPPPPAAR